MQGFFEQQLRCGYGRDAGRKRLQSCRIPVILVAWPNRGKGEPTSPSICFIKTKYAPEGEITMKNDEDKELYCNEKEP